MGQESLDHWGSGRDWSGDGSDADAADCADAKLVLDAIGESSPFSVETTAAVSSTCRPSRAT
jgi:hypothetical protein